METRLLEPTIKKIALPNKFHSKKIDLRKLYDILKDNSSFQPTYDTDINPSQNWVTITFTGTAKVFSNGTVTTNLNLPNSALIEIFDKIYIAYIKEALE
jgi:hypothetical protein